MKAIKIVREFFEDEIAPPHKIVAMEKQQEGGYRGLVEVVEEREYMKKYAHDEMIGLYEVFVEDDEVSSFQRVSLRYRTDLEEQSS
ncbi:MULTISPECIES: gas vesicle protein GvpR [Salimicrobium]|uniref:Gas vesicle protein GvpR n=4 Tax=Salimicrobium TaxID=351195 RepID=K2GCY4_9BACI|nr:MULTISPECIES: gas vesicle protein GvpR [Salimicrobium]AKG03848.1 gas vesicle protein GvpR [Salimicrobium jeotgali]EKE32873.1 gas vesicle protein GvpR [Salimicrobium jeotgali]MBM7695134.1 hypothetical protein [Salimicrobium jeotgali]PBB05672.1 gas vesicle protein GvpR [Salimicrobium humidisoli]SDX95901.1 hypothetical protein SAMN04488081_1723 [Salimicrobium album]